MSYIVEVTVARMRGSMAAALSAKPPQPQMPQMPTRSESTSSRVSRQSTAALKSSVLISGEVRLRGVPPLSPQKEGSKAMARKPRSASDWA